LQADNLIYSANRGAGVISGEVKPTPRSAILDNHKEEEMRQIIFGMLLALVVGLVGCATTPVETTSTTKPTMSNSELERAIKDKLATDSQLKAADIDVDADASRNEATLSGTVESQALRTKAVDLTKSAHAGLLVTDKIDVKPREISRTEYTEELAHTERERAKSYGETIGNTLDDAWIHAKIVTKLIGDPDTPERKINVDVVNNMVTLRGTVNSAEQKAEAERIAKSTEGVKGVKNMLQVKAGA
jgi:hyperosmotically inducible periplasmic protein